MLEKNPLPFINYDSAHVLELGSGKRAHAYGVDNFVVKEVHGGNEKISNPSVLLAELRSQYDLLRNYLDPYVLETDFILAQPQANETRIYIAQKKVEGLSFGTGIEQARAENNLRQIQHFLMKARRMWRETGYIPDMFGSKKSPQTMFNPRKTQNVLIVPEENYRPVLVDTNLAMRGRDAFSRYVYNPLLAYNLRGLSHQLERE